MKSSGLLKWLMIPVALLALFAGIKLFSHSKDDLTSPPSKSSTNNQLTADEMKALGIEGDTPRDTVATLVAQVKQLRQELQTAIDDNKQQKVQNEQLRLRDTNIDQRIQNALKAEREQQREAREHADGEDRQTRSLLEDMERRLEGLGKNTKSDDLPVGLGLDDRDAASFEKPRWVEPQDARPGDTKTSVPPSSRPAGDLKIHTSFESTSEQEPSEAVADTVAPRRAPAEADSVKPTFTVPSNATLMGSIAMTALIGRIPIDGTVNDPYPFKVVIGADNLTANGIDLPDLAGAVASGTASGDWTLSCVRGQIRSLTFVFNDGTVRTVSASSGHDDAASSTMGGLGWISDRYGIPCVSGERRSNAQQYLGSQLLITAAGAGAASLIESGSSNFSYASGSNGTLGTVGISGNEAMGRILGGGVQEMSQWVNKLYGQAFAAIYVRPRADVAVHIEQPLEIDYDPKGRKVNHRAGESNVSDLD
jgi:integrating conjugative element protein (TIGR03752 family)